jgi:hypothetical protein
MARHAFRNPFPSPVDAALGVPTWQMRALPFLRLDLTGGFSKLSDLQTL